MNFIEAKQEFHIRYYYWATSEFEKEINESFPNLRSFRNGPIWELHEFMQQIDNSQQVILAHGLLKRFHPDAVKILGESFSDEETFLLNKCDEVRSQLNQIANRAETGNAGTKIKFASKARLRKTIMDNFIKAYGDRCVKILTKEGWDPRFEMKVAGWIVTTQFAFGRHESLINYNHSIESEAKIPNPKFPSEFWMPTMRLEHLISYASWLGICSQTRWTHLGERDVDQACNDVIRLCGYFFEVTPKLFKGIEFETITEVKPAVASVL